MKKNKRFQYQVKVSTRQQVPMSAPLWVFLVVILFHSIKTYTVKGFFKNQQGSREAHNKQRLCAEQAEDDPLHRC